MTNPPLWTVDDARSWFLQLVGVPAVAILTINTLLVVTEWVRAVRGAARTTSRVSIWAARVSRERWSALGPALRFGLTFIGLALGQALGVALLYLTCRMLYSLPLVIWPSDGPASPAWSTFVASVVAPPTEDSPWTLYAFVAALALAATFDAALVLRAKILRSVSQAAVMVLGFALWAVLLVVGGISGLFFIIMGLLRLAAGLSGAEVDQGLAWILGLALGVATAAVAYLTMLVGGFFIMRTADLLDPEDELRMRRPARSST